MEWNIYEENDGCKYFIPGLSFRGTQVELNDLWAAWDENAVSLFTQ